MRNARGLECVRVRVHARVRECIRGRVHAVTVFVFMVVLVNVCLHANTRECVREGVRECSSVMLVFLNVIVNMFVKMSSYWPSKP